MLLRLTDTAFFLIGMAPYRLRCLFFRGLAVILAPFFERERKVAEAQIAMALPNENAQKLSHALFSELGTTLGECCNIGGLLNDPEFRLELQNDQLLRERLLDREQPAVILTAHFGNWDLLAAYGVKRGLKLSTIGREARSKTAQAILARFRQHYGVKTLWRSGRSAVIEIVRELQSGGTVAALIDQDTRVKSLSIPFFGRPAATPVTLVQLARREGALIASAFLIRLGPKRYRIAFEFFDSDLSEEEVLTQFNQRLERVIRDHPAQWVWFHKRWRTLVDGSRLSSAEYLRYLKSALVSLILLFSGCAATNYREKAEEYTRREDYDQAIEAYRRHIAERLAIKDRPEWENPNFYLLLIGDIELARGQYDAALAAYQQAEDAGVERITVSDRYRYVASWYERNGELESAIAVLQQYRDRDPLLFDLVLDRLGKEIVRRSDALSESK